MNIIQSLEEIRSKKEQNLGVLKNIIPIFNEKKDKKIKDILSEIYYEPYKMECNAAYQNNINILDKCSNFYGKLPIEEELGQPLWFDEELLIFFSGLELKEYTNNSFCTADEFLPDDTILLHNEMNLNNILSYRDFSKGHIFIYYDDIMFLVAIQLLDLSFLSDNNKFTLIYGKKYFQMIFSDSSIKRPNVIIGQNTGEYKSFLADPNWPINYIYNNVQHDLHDKKKLLKINTGYHSTKGKKPVFSIAMCVYNATDFLNSAVNSVWNQTFLDWELIILDNGSKNKQAWEMIETAASMDERIIGIKGEENVGWAKGTSLCLQKASGEYMTFLAADDCLHPDALERIYKEIKINRPDIIWVGHAEVRYDDNELVLSSFQKPAYSYYKEENYPEWIELILSSVYYNSMFHYANIEFLRKNNIDFFHPYFGDCAGMTQAMCAAETMTVLDKVVYYLTIETSQTRGNYLWDCYDYIFASQWNSIIMLYKREGYFNRDSLAYISAKIAKNHFSVIRGLCCGGNCRNKYMVDIKKSQSERLRQVEDTLSDVKIMEMMYYYGRKLYSDKIISIIQTLFDGGYSQFNMDEIVSQCDWLGNIILGLYERKEKGIVPRKKVEKEHLVMLIEGIIHEKNIGMFGFELLIPFIENIQAYMEYSEMSVLIKRTIKRYAMIERQRLIELVDVYISKETLLDKCRDDFLLECKTIYDEIKDVLDLDEELIKIKSYI